MGSSANYITVNLINCGHEMRVSNVNMILGWCYDNGRRKPNFATIRYIRLQY